ncbi:rhomboid family intramembrane serine protease [Tenacibaculum sp. IB213877]|uniref:rhomboid family intramembrane serine protease n=1 Tax=Tenacibaculum sp. IB213877 TaxID=3097351 RepID=UPI002A5ABD5A|nr:rhomboid family intramembrane serine protease [Tenacibaculum sp. IB213877]MDY0779869.1 rhomboid family intramembrane serine protease [Tenacibaculum sp. IB213877]
MNELNNLKHRFKNAGIVEQLIYINVAVFILVFVFNTFGYMFQVRTNFLIKWFALPANFDDFITKPWTIVTYGFLHGGFIHILLNLVALYYIGHLFKQYFTGKQLLNFYLYGTVFGGILFLVSYNYLPAFAKDAHNNILVGASAGISAIFIGIATYLPNYQLRIPLIGYIKLWHLASFWVLLDVIQIPAGNAGGHLAHLGGALFGFLYVRKASNKEIDIFKPVKELFTKKNKPLKTVHNSGNKRNRTAPKSNNQEKIDAILDKISKSGYDALTKAEKEFLFKQGKN